MKGDNLKVTKGNNASLIRAGKATRFGPEWPGQRCLANTRSGTPCQKPALKGKARCQLHGGRSTGAKTSQGIERIRVANTITGKFTAEAQQTRKLINAEIRSIEHWARACGYL